LNNRISAAEAEVEHNLDAKIVAALERLAQALHTSLWHTAWKKRLSATQAQILIYLLAAPESRTTVSELARRFSLKQSTLSDAVSALVRKGLLQRATDAHDRRVVWLRLSPRGRALARRMGEWVAPLRRQLGSLPQSQKGLFLETLLQLIAGLQRAGVIEVARMCTTCVFFEPHRYSDPQAPHHCRLLNQPLRLAELRVECPDHQPVPSAQ
jgi:DNA-binding MarR family transcriptional regulator